MQNDELRLLIASKLDVSEFLDIIGWTMYDLVEALEEVITENSVELERACE
jgi:hypothetical protein